MSAGYKAKSDSYLMKMTKAEIIEELRTAEHNFFATEEAFHNATESAKKTCDNLEKENAKLKRLLKLAVEDISIAMGDSTCAICKFILRGCDDSTPCTWRHLEEAMKLIGGENE
ncbi:hypothetical protein [uncultured Eubacterium sp.]|uniref:hypothetical protein n=1 Tax=uncultured Eubacterium sp. TaxID=165185 RepID=UPI00261AFE72|nr:hypothetical protein [uncultured Eubacterium sp.]